jgi:hypothetical protein
MAITSRGGVLLGKFKKLRPLIAFDNSRIVTGSKNNHQI